MKTTEEERELEVVALHKRLLDPVDDYTANDHLEEAAGVGE